MDWKKVKTLLILLLLCANVFMMSVLIANYRAEHFLSNEMIQNVPTILSKKGVALKEGLLRAECVTFYHYNLNADSDSIRRFAGKASAGFEEDSTVESQIEVSDFASFSFSFSETVQKFDTVPELVKYLAYMGDISEKELSFIRKETKEDQTIVYFEQYIDGIRVEGSRLQVELVEGKAQRAEGVLLLNKNRSANVQSKGDPITALFLFAEQEQEPVNIQALYPIYRAKEGAWGVVTLTPGFVIETDTGKRFFVDISEKKIELLESISR